MSVFNNSRHLGAERQPRGGTHDLPSPLIMSTHEARQLHSQHGLSIPPLLVVTGLFLLRTLNALCTGRTFFQPDEYFQALEPAWNLAFGPHSGAWLTWVYLHQSAKRPQGPG